MIKGTSIGLIHQWISQMRKDIENNEFYGGKGSLYFHCSMLNEARLRVMNDIFLVQYPAPDDPSSKSWMGMHALIKEDIGECNTKMLKYLQTMEELLGATTKIIMPTQEELLETAAKITMPTQTEKTKLRQLGPATSNDRAIPGHFRACVIIGSYAYQIGEDTPDRMLAFRYCEEYDSGQQMVQIVDDNGKDHIINGKLKPMEQ